MMQCEAFNANVDDCDPNTDLIFESKSDLTSVSSITDGNLICETQGSLETIRHAQEVVSCLSDRCEELERLRDGIPVIRKEIHDQIDQSMHMVQRAVNERREFLLGELDNILHYRDDGIIRMHDEFEARLQRLSSHLDSLKRLVQMSPSSASSKGTEHNNSYPQPRNLAVQKHTQEIEKLLGIMVPLHPSEFDTMSFFPTELDQVLSMIRCVGVIGLTSTDARNTTLITHTTDDISPIRRCAINEQVKLDIVPQDSLGRCVLNPTSKEFTVSLSSRNENVNEVQLSDCNPSGTQSNHSSREQLITGISSLQVMYRISTPGTYDLGIKLLGEHIQGSPYLIYARPHCKPEMKVLLDTMKQLSEMPQRIQRVVVTRRRCKSAPDQPVPEQNFQALADINKVERGDFLYSFGTKGRGDGEFANPSGVCVTRENKFLVADSNNATVQVFNSQAQYLRRIGEYGYHPGQLMRPMDVAETINGNYLVSDFELHCVTVFNISGSYMSRFGQRYLAGPKGIVADSRGRILVVDQKSCMVCIFKPTGKFINRFGARGTADNQFTNPTSVAVNSQDEIYVADYALHAIKVFDPNGLYLFQFGVHGMDPGCLHSPSGLTFDGHDNIYISDWGNNRIQVFDSIGTFLRILCSPLEPLNGPQGLMFHHQSQRLVVSDPGNYCVKVFAPRDIVRSVDAGEAGEAGETTESSPEDTEMKKSSSDTFSLSV